MAKQTTGRIRHVALSVQDPWETAEFYKEALGLEEVTELDGALAEGLFLTDGVVNLALLKFKTDEAAQGTGKDFDIAAHGWAGSQKDPGQSDNIVHANPKRRLAKFDERREAARANIEARKVKQATAAE